MHLTEGHIYHVFNRGNNKEPIFFKTDNYYYFLKNVSRFLLPHCEMLAYCLMPNHFHFLIYATEKSIPVIKDGSFERQQFSKGIKQLLSSYTKAINKQEGRTGSLFQQKTKAVNISDTSTYDPRIAFHYIHQNPMKAGLVKRLEDWEFSSFGEYAGIRNRSICNLQLAKQCLDLNLERLYEESYSVINFSFE
ncbi:MAG TPA: transposase [Cyclobacteriaceae bacterium]|nr:transposase [Cyclobacteriaceae bacterium]HRJ82955.1 transposase [Cyclobacteriaceae bacterium]